MNEMQEILKKLEGMEQRIENLEGKKVENKPVSSSSTFIDPEKMPVGYISYAGRYVSPDNSMGSTFGADLFKISNLLDCNSFEMARVIDAFSSEERINIVKELIQTSMTAKQLMEKLKFQTTGKLYHHLSFLEKIGVIRKDSDFYHVRSKFISCVILIAMGVERIIRKNNDQQD